MTIQEIREGILRYYPEADLQLIDRAYEVAEKAHRGQKRSSGDPYIIHPMHVAQNLVELKLDLPSIATGLLHDTVEDTSITLDDIRRDFGTEIADLVDGVTKLGKITFRTSEEKQAENFRKMIIAMAKDIRVILVKLCDRMSNMRTLEFLEEGKQKQIAQETLDIYAPIANRLGMGRMKVELEDLCFKFLHRESYSRLSDSVLQTRKDREKYIEEVCELLKEKLKEYEISARVQGRAKHFYSIYKKMERQKLDFEQIYDVIGFRIVVDNITECYKALGVIHALYKPVPGRIKDYIAMPKANSYQSLHTTVIGPYGERVEIQIRTEQMDQIADRGIAAHWRYKEGRFDHVTREKVEWVNRLVEWQKDLADPNEFLETVKIDLFDEDVFVFTPEGEVRQLPLGSTPLDFAYAIHTNLGHQCAGAKVNGKIVHLKYRLKSGDTVEVLSNPNQQPSKDWLSIVKTSRAKAKIRASIKQHERDRARVQGRELLERALKPYGRNLAKLEKGHEVRKALEALSMRNDEELYAALGYGRVFPDAVVAHLVPDHEIKAKASADEAAKETEKQEKSTKPDEAVLKQILKSVTRGAEMRNSISVANLADVLVRFGKCCNPIPGDGIIGFITRGRGVTVHTATCTKAIDMDTERRVDVSWNRAFTGTRHPVRVRVLCRDEPGVLAALSLSMSGLGINISSATVRTTKDRKAICIFDIDISDTAQLQKIMGTLESKSGVIAVERMLS